MSEVKNIDSLKKFVAFGLSLEKFGKDVLAGGSFHPEKLGELLAIYGEAAPAFAGMSDAVPELQNLDASEIAELTAMIVAGGVMSEHAGSVLEKSLNLAACAYALFVELKK